MTDKEILEKAIQKAIDGGWKTSVGFRLVEPPGINTFLIEWSLADDEEEYKLYEPYEAVIYNHQFAKALWNTPRFAPAGSIHFETRDGLSEWQYHLREMVISPDPIQYLKDNLRD